MIRSVTRAQILVLGVLAVVVSCECEEDGPTEPGEDPYDFSPGTLVLDTAFVDGSPAEGVVDFRGWRGREMRLDSLVGPACPSGLSWSPNTGTVRFGTKIPITFRFDPEQPVLPGSCRLSASVDGGVDQTKPRLTVRYAAWEGRCGVAPDSVFTFPEVLVGESTELTVSISNTRPEPSAANRFKYLFHGGSSDCSAFSLEPADSAAVVGPAETREIVVSFRPDAEGAYHCRRELSTLRGLDETDPLSAEGACPSRIEWFGTGSDPAVTWSDCSPGASNDWHGVFGLSDSEVYAAGTEGAVISSTGSCTWTSLGTGFTAVNLKDLWGSKVGSDPILWAVGNRPPDPPGTGTILIYGGGSWEEADEDGFHNYATVWGSGADAVYVAGTAIASDFPNAKYWNGAAFSSLTIGQFGIDPVGSLGGTGSTDIWAVIAEVPGGVYRFQGADWEDVAAPFMDKALYDVWVRDTGPLYAAYAVGAGGTIYAFEGASGWSDVSVAGESRDFYGVWVSPQGKVIVVGEDKVIYEGAVGSAAWDLQGLPRDLPSSDLLDVWGAPDGSIYAVGTNGVIVRGG